MRGIAERDYLASSPSPGCARYSRYLDRRYWQHAPPWAEGTEATTAS